MGNRECGEGNAQGVPAGDYGEIDGDLTYCPKDGVWSYTWHWCGDGPDPGPNAYDAGAYVDNYRR